MNVAVIEVLEKVTSQDPSFLKQAEQTLREWEIQRGFYTTLYNIFSNHSLPTNVRWMAIVYFKNGIDKYWRKHAPSEIAEDEKEFLRRSLLSNFDEPVNQVATHLAITVSKIARLDYPRDWETLIPSLLEVIGGENSLAQHRALLTLRHVVKALASKRLYDSKAQFYELTNNIFNFILNIWNTYTESFLILASNGADKNQICERLEIALFSLRILRYLIVDGLNSINDSKDAMLFFKLIFERARTCLECRKTLMLHGIQIESLEKFIVNLIKVLNGSTKIYLSSDTDFMRASLEFTVYYCFTDAGMSYTFEKFVIQCLRLLESLLKLDWVQNIRLKRRTPAQDSLRSRSVLVKQEFFTSETLKEICSKFFTHYFLLTPADLDLWDTDPEGFAGDFDESWTSSIRTSTREIFKLIVSEFSIKVQPMLFDLMQTYYNPVDPNDFQAILMKDAVYLATGLVVINIWNGIDLDRWILTTLKEELENKNSSYKIIKRRICWVIKQWVYFGVDNLIIPELYKSVINILSSEKDLVVRLEACSTLKYVLVDLKVIKGDEVSISIFETTFSLLFNLLCEVSECDSKMLVLNTLSYLIEKVGPTIKSHLSPLGAYWPMLWQLSKNHNMFKCAIISAVIHYVEIIGNDSFATEPMIINMVAYSCDLNQDAHVYLLEDGLGLWLAILENATCLTPEMVNLFQNIPALLDSGLDNVTLEPAFNIIQAYVLLNPQEFMGELGSRVIEGIKGIFSDLRTTELLTVLGSLELILKATLEQGAQLIKPLLGKIIKDIYYDSAENWRVAAMNFAVISRVLINSREVFAQVVSELACEIGGDQTDETVLGRIIEVWLLHINDDVIENERLKYFGFALCSLINSDSPPIVFTYFAKIIHAVVEILNDLFIFENGKMSYDPLLLENHNKGSLIQVSSDDEEEEQQKTEHTRRLMRLEMKDPICTICLKDYLCNQLITLRRVMGNDQFDRMFATLGSEFDQQLREFLHFE